MIHEQCDVLTRLSTRVTNSTQESKIVDALIIKRQTLNESVNEVKKIIFVLEVIKDINTHEHANYRFNIDQNPLKKLIRKFEEFRVKFERDYNSILEGNDFGIIISASTEFSKLIIKQRDDFWDKFSKSIEIQFFDDDILEFKRKLTNDPLIHNEIDNFKVNKSELGLLLNKFPKSPEELSKIFTLKYELLKVQASLPSVDNAEIENFIKNAHDQGVLLSEFTENIKRWLAENKMEEEFRIYKRYNNAD